MVKVLNREIGNRMWGGKSNVYGVSGGGTGGGDVDLSSYATMAWTKQNFVSIEYFRTLFKAFDSNDDEIVPNNTTSVVDNIKAMVGLWTEQYLTALGNQSGGGGGGGGASYLNDLLDVQLTTPLTDGQALVYNTTLQKWVNGDAGVNMTTVWNALAGSTNEQINATHLSTALSGYVTTSDISDMATRTWVGQQGFATQTWVTSNFITIAYFDRLFRAYNDSTLVSHNDTTTTIDNIKAMFGFWTDFYLSALGTGGVSSVSISLSQLADVTLTSPTGGQALVYDATNNVWVNGTVAAGVTSLSALSDVVLTAPATYEVLMYDASTTKWYNTALKTINGVPIYGSGDISVGGGASGNYLPLAGGTMVGTINTVENAIAIQFRWASTSGNYNSKLAYYTQGDEALAFGQKNSVSSYLFYTGVDLPATSVWHNLGTPALQIKSNCVSINSLFESNSAIGYNLYVNGTGYVTTSLRAADINLERGNEINTYGKYLHLQYNSGTNVTLCVGGGNVQVGVDSGNSARLNVGGTGRFEEELSVMGVKIERTNEINSYDGSSNNIHLNYRVGGVVSLCCGGGNVGIGTYSASYKLHVAGTIYATGNVTALSDARHKIIINDAAINVEQIAKMPAVVYRWNDGREDNGLHVGSIAQDWQRILPEVVMRANDEEGTLSMQYGVAALVSSIIIARKVVNHEERIEQLEKENKELKERLKIA